jgi:hypothetical protein
MTASSLAATGSCARASHNKNNANSGNRQGHERRQTRIGFADMLPDAQRHYSLLIRSPGKPET